MNLCDGCRIQMPDVGYMGFKPFVLDERPHEKHFCTETCAKKWALVEAVRLREWLSRILKDTRGIGADLASQALYSNRPANEGKRRKSA